MMSNELRVPIRKGFFTRIFTTVSNTLPEIYTNAYFDEDDALFLSQLYFQMSDGYKKWRVEDDHYTNDYKKAGLTTTTIMAMRPIRFGELKGDDRRPFYANPIFAMACATAILNQPVTSISREDREQFYAWLDTLRFPSTESFLADAAVGKLPHFQSTGLKLSFDEISGIDMTVQKYKDICRCFDLEQRLRDLSEDP